jgi:2-polyprenyl-3-methyl-5-hydroxy-6-metoxy-1,4-benzoquinol methylase
MTEEQRRKRKPPVEVTTWMREDWDERAREDARYYINDREHEGFDFALSGCRDVYETLGPLHQELRHDMKVLEIGCGMGRMLQFMAVLFAEVHGIDVAPTMVEQARRYLARSPNVIVHQGDGRSLQGLQDGYFDLVLSFQVFQHIPDKAVVSDYLREMFRVLKPAGLARFLAKTKPWAGQGAEHDTWCGVELSKDDLAGWLKQDPWQLRSAADSDDPTKAWVLLQKPQ